MVDDLRDIVGGDVWRLRREVVQHPVHGWAGGRQGVTTLMVHRGFCQWASAALAASVGLPAPARHLDLTRARLRREGAGRVLDAFLDEPLAARAPAAAQPLVEVVGYLLADGSGPARLGAFTCGVPCCIADQGPALELLGPPTAEAAEAAREVLVAQLALYDGALDTIRRRQMMLHPSAWRSG